jgi:hypothetical protein
MFLSLLVNLTVPERAIQELRRNGEDINDELLQNLSPLSWDHINLTGDYIWRSNAKTASDN